MAGLSRPESRRAQRVLPKVIRRSWKLKQLRLFTAFLCLLFFAAVPVPSASAATLSADAEAATGTLITAPPSGTPDGGIGIRVVDVPVATQNDPGHVVTLLTISTPT